ncbi:hypothetical protein DVH24_042701 [Malus domestica]|uniref:Uncharacterized protein n=1 Tax=Malus domestica TaxID=3750 RepID=A0A498I0Q5_MALDO|nr:hypothetical protein DVH24_042701 [Malus domestica]
MMQDTRPNQFLQQQRRQPIDRTQQRKKKYCFTVSRVTVALNFGRDFIDANGAIPGVCNGSKPSLTSPIQWSHSKAGFVKLNFDGSVVHQGAAAVFVMRNENGEPMDAGARFVGQNTISVVECLVLRDGMWMARPKV